uniref:Uncharacterized protein n=1 Tax=Leersia perrieri TaxID=77586 RepID=A0A0D9XC44_9ORYZ
MGKNPSDLSSAGGGKDKEVDSQKGPGKRTKGGNLQLKIHPRKDEVEPDGWTIEVTTRPGGRTKDKISADPSGNVQADNVPIGPAMNTEDANFEIKMSHIMMV